MQKEDYSLGELFSELANETSTLVRQEMSLAQAEMTEKAKRAGKNAGFIAAGGAIGYAGLLAMCAGLVMILGYILPMWLSAMFVGAALAGVSYCLVMRGIEVLKKMEVAPTETVQTLKEDAKWLRKQMS
jgi:hypothetical protein